MKNLFTIVLGFVAALFFIGGITAGTPTVVEHHQLQCIPGDRS